LTEFLPISSSGHLILVPRLFEWEDQGLSFDVGLHVGTLLALLVYFWRDWARMIPAAFGRLTEPIARRTGGNAFDGRLFWLIALGSIPAAVVGLLFSNWLEDNVRQPWIIAISLAVMGTLMLLAELWSRRNRPLVSINARDAILIGAAQAVALIPGVSRSGATMTMGLARDFDRQAAARFAFLLGTPAFIGAALLKLDDLAGASRHEFVLLAIGFACSAVVGFLVIHFLLAFLRTRSLVPFVMYRYGAAALTLVIAGFRYF
jgi:undecaprenyl-diphosphatase